MPNFKEYHQGQCSLLPASPRDWLPDDHICFLIDEAVEQLDLTAIEATYSNKGCSAYDPAMMLKVLFYAYTQAIRSSRKIEMALYENCAFRYLSGNQHPDHGTINLFRKQHLTNLEEIFAQIVLLCGGLGITDFSDISIDGSKFKASASKKQTLTREQLNKLKQQCREILEQAEQVDAREDEMFGKDNRGYNQIPEHLRDKQTRQKQIARVKEKLQKLNQAQAIIEQRQNQNQTKQEKNLNRNRKVNLTDLDANLMPLKRNKSFQPAYNAQLATSQQVILSYEISTNASDSESLIPMIERTEQTTQHKVKQVKADSGYFSQDNLNKAKKRHTQAYIPDRAYAQKQKQKQADESSQASRTLKFKREEFDYNQSKDEFTCPQGKTLSFITRLKTGTRIYKCSDCAGCPLKDRCTKADNRMLALNVKQEQCKQEMREKLNTKRGKSKYLERFSDVEPVIGNIKHNQSMRQFSCRGKPMALTEFGLCCAAHNLVKIFNWAKKTGNNLQTDYILQLNTPTRLEAVV